VNRHASVYRRLLVVYPAAFREAYADEMTRLFVEQMEDARASQRPFATSFLWATAILDLAMTAPGERWKREAIATQPASGSALDLRAEPPRSARGLRVAVGLLPMWLLALFLLFAPGFMDPVFLSPPSVVGLPFGLVVLALALGWMAIGVIGLLRTSSTAAAIVLFGLFTVPPMMLLCLTPALILVVVNLVIEAAP
jgi:hypothetical protein